MAKDNTLVFSEYKVPKAVGTLALPSMLGMLINIVYNLADTFFVGQTGDQNQVAAVSVSMPMFLFFLAIGNLFGVGGCAFISRSLGEGQKDKIKTISSFCIYSGIMAGAVLAVLFIVFRRPILFAAGATENIMMAASLAEGTTILENAAEEPEIVDLANYLNKMGAKIRGAGTDTIRIEGVEKLHGADYTIIPDRIEAGTYMIAAAMTGGDIVVENVLPEHQKPLIAKLREAGAVVEEDIDKVRVIGKNPLKAVSIKTLPYPGFPTDMQAQMMAMMVIAEGRSKVTETVFENRFMHVVELNRMGAQISTEGRSAVIDGPCKLTGCDVRATDLRAGAAMILAGLVAEGTTRIGDLHHIDRGYENIVAKLKNLGADIERVDVD